MIRPRLSPPDMNPEGIGATDWVRKLGCKRVGEVESVSNDHALVAWLNGTKELIACVHLRRVPPDARPDLDRRGG
jgi:hypothetical protein